MLLSATLHVPYTTELVTLTRATQNKGTYFEIFLSVWTAAPSSDFAFLVESFRFLR